MCTLCHGVNLEGGVGPACTSCHVVDPVANPSGCVSCHNLPPDSDVLAGNVRPNRQGGHFKGVHENRSCSTCHSGSGNFTSIHYDTAAPADVVFANGGTYNPANGGSCSGTGTGCHGSGTEGPWY